MRTFYFLFLSFLFCFAKAQEQGKPNTSVQMDVDKSATVSVSKYDTNYYRKYPDRLVLSYYQSYRSFQIEVDQKLVSNPHFPTALKFAADANNASGFEVDYDKFGLALDFKSTPPDDVAKKGNTTYKGLGLSLGGSKWRLESSYSKYVGFYDLNTVNYDTSYKADKPYYQNSSLSARSAKFKFIYFFKHKRFAYNAAYGYTARQLKSSISWVGVSNLHVNDIRTDTSFAPYLIRKDYGSYSDWNSIGVIGASAGGGGSFSLVIFKRFFFNLTVLVGPEMQWRSYGYVSSGLHRYVYLGTASDLRAAFGFNNRNFFITVNFLADYHIYNSGQLKMQSNFIAGSTNIGYRFKVKEPGIMNKIRKYKAYQWM